MKNMFRHFMKAIWSGFCGTTGGRHHSGGIAIQ